MALTQTQVSQLYVTVIGRASEGEGNTFWQAGDSLASVATDMLATEAAQTYFGNTLDDDQAFIEHIYENTLGKTYADDPDGIDFWVSVLQDSTRGEVVAGLIEAVYQYSDSTDPEAKAAYDQFVNKVEVSNYVADSIEEADINDLTPFEDYIKNVTDDPTTVDAAKADVDTDSPAVPASITAATTSVTEGNAITFTIEMDRASSSDVDVNYVIEGVETSVAAAATPVDDLGKKNGVVTVPAGETSVTVTLTPSADGVTEGLEAFVVKVLDADFEEVVSSSNVVIQDPENAGQSFTLTTGVDEKTTGAGNDTFTGVIDDDSGSKQSTLSPLDDLDGGDGTDTLSVNILQNIDGDADATSNAAVLPGIALANIETMNVRAAVKADLDVSSFTDIETVNVTQAVGELKVVAADTADVNTSGSKETVTVEGGKDVTITDATADKDITASTLATTKNATGEITVTDSDQGTGNIVVDGGSNVTVTASTEYSELGAPVDHSAAGGTQKITVGANKAATGDVVVTKNTTLTDATNTITTGDMAVTGGSTITVNNNISNTATKDSGAANDITSGDIAVTANDSTTEVTVNQTVAANDYDSVTTGDSKETATITFGALKEGEAVVVGESSDADGAPDGNVGAELTFVASQDLTAEEVAAAFANLTSADTQANGGVVANGYFLGALDSGWTSGAADGDAVTFTATDVGDETDLEVETNADTDTEVAQGDGTNNADFKVSVTDGAAGTPTTARDISADYGDVTIDDTADNTITDVTVDGYAALDIGLGAPTPASALESLANLSLANSAGTATIDTAAGITSLNLTLNDVDNAVDLSTNSSGIATLNVTTTGDDSGFAITAADVKDLNVGGDQKLTLTGTTTALENVVVTDTASLDISGVGTDAAKSIDTTGTTGTVTADIDGTAATYTGGAGKDNVTLVTGTALDKDIDLGAGADTVVFSAAVTGSSATLSGGDDTDTLSMDVARAAALDGSTQSFYTNFERLTINDGVASDTTIDLANLGFTDYVTTTGNAQTLYTDATLADVDGDTFTFAYNGMGYTATLVDANDGTGALTVEDYENAVDAAVDADGVALGADKITATINAGDDLVLDVDSAGNSVVGGTHSNNGTAITATNPTLTLDKMDSDGTLVLDGSGAVQVDVTDADTGTADILNIEADVAITDYNYGQVTAADVETVNISATDTNVDEDDDGTEYETGDRDATTLTLTADSATTVNVTGNADVDLTLTGSTKVTMIDGSTMTGALDVTSVTTSDPVTIKGGEGGDTLVAAGTEDVIMGGAGADTITGSDLTEMTGGEGNDTFIANTPTNVNSYSIIMDYSSGDIIDFSNVTSTGNSFVASEVTLGGTAVFQDLANAAVNKLATNDDDIAWFQFDDNNDGTSDTYIVVNDNQADAVDANFENGTDSIIKIMGEVDLSADATFNATDATLQMA